MSNENHSQYLKTPHVLKIINKDGVACEEKLTEIKNLIDGKGLKVLPPGEELPNNTPEASVESNPVPTPTATQAAIEKIVSEISGAKEKQLARSLLNEIDRSDYISFDPDTLEIIVNGENIKFSNVKNLVQYCISANPSQLPLGIAIFLDSLIKIKIPNELLRHGDALGIRDSLLKIEELKRKGSLSGENIPPPSETASGGVEEVTGEGGGEEGEQSGRGKKREREDDEDVDGGASVLNPAKKTYGLSRGSLDKIRTSPKLSEKILEKWRNAAGEKSRKRKATLEFPVAEEEYSTEIKPTTGSKRKRVTADFVPEEEEELGRGKRKRQ